MILRVPLAEFARAAREVCGAERGYATGHRLGSLLTAGGRGAIVMAKSAEPVGPELDGLPISEGQWTREESAEPTGAFFIAAVAYATGTQKPGLWLDASSESRTSAEIVQALYDEFSEGGEIEEMTFDQFVEAAHPTVIELSPEDLAQYLAAKEAHQ